MLAAKVVYVFAFTFFQTPTGPDEWFLSISLFVGSLLVFYSFLTQRPYFNDQAQKVAPP